MTPHSARRWNITILLALFISLAFAFATLPSCKYVQPVTWKGTNSYQGKGNNFHKPVKRRDVKNVRLN